MNKKTGLLFCLLIITPATFCQQDTLPNPADTAQGNYYEIFSAVDPAVPEEPIRIEIEFDYRDFLKMKYQDTSLQASLTVFDHDTLLYSTNVKIKARGEVRRKICFFPPFELNFKKSDPDVRYTGEMNKLKVVTQCRNSKIYEQYILKEYLCYRMYNLLTDYSYKVRIVEIKFTDSAGKIKPYTNYGFIIETNDHLCDRIKAFPVDIKGIKMNQTDFDAVNLMSVYQFMIGNTDWDLPSLHNIRLFKLQDYKRLAPVPITYDLDYAGMVNTDYAIPHPRFNNTTVRERVYMGYCIPANSFKPIFDLFIEKESQFNSLIDNCTYLNKFNKGDMHNYLKEFYSIIKIPRKAETDIYNRCFPTN
jgi:hypothetical protein